MKVYAENPNHLSRAMKRVASALCRNVIPGIAFADTERLADVVVLHVIGFAGLHETLERLRGRGQRYAIMQYCLRTTERPHTSAWLPVWQDALSVWSYYDLKQAMKDDGVEGDFNFYYAPLGVDSSFQHGHAPEEFRAFSTGYVAETECLQEVADACARVEAKMMHVGGRCVQGAHVTRAEGISDHAYVNALRRSRYVTGLRRCEGFELPAAEGLVTGVRPIVFDAPHYRNWFEDMAEYVPESSPDAVTNALTEIFAGNLRPVTADERARATEAFNWRRLVGGFYRSMQ